MTALVLRLDAPLISFGSTIIDRHGFIDRFPGVSMLCGLIANALGWEHGDFARLQALQERIEFAARWDVPPERMVDYHTVDLGQSKMSEPGWTTRGVPEHREGGLSARLGTHERLRHYWTDGLMTVVLTLKGNGDPTIDQVRNALKFPARPLFLGRKTCLPSRPILDPVSPVVEGTDVLTILRSVPVWDRFGIPLDNAGRRQACWPGELDSEETAELRWVHDLRDWANQLPAGSRLRAEGLIGEED